MDNGAGCKFCNRLPNIGYMAVTDFLNIKKLVESIIQIHLE